MTINGLFLYKHLRLLSTVTRKMCTISGSSTPKYSFKTLEVTNPSEWVFHVQLNRTEKLNAMNMDMWNEIGHCFNALNEDSACRAVVLSGKGNTFTAGIDLSDLGQIVALVSGDEDIARKSRAIKKVITNFQSSLSSLEKCAKPVIAAVHGPCIGAGVDLICSADIRYSSAEAWFQVKEVDIGLAADVGTLQRLPKIIGSESLVRELCFTARKFFASEAERCGFVSRVLPDRNALISSALKLAVTIAEKSPVAVQATKEALIHARDHSVEDGLNYIASINMNYLQSEDLLKAGQAAFSKEKATFSKL